MSPFHLKVISDYAKGIPRSQIAKWAHCSQQRIYVVTGRTEYYTNGYSAPARCCRYAQERRERFKQMQEYIREYEAITNPQVTQ